MQEGRMIEPTKVDIGREVFYRATMPMGKKINEKGVIIRFDARVVWVKFRFSSNGGLACNRRDLHWTPE